MTQKLSNAEFLERLKELNPDAEPLEEYKDYHTKIKVKYKSCGHVDYKSPSKLYRGQGCGTHECKVKRIGEAKIERAGKRNVEKAKKLGIILLERYKGNKDKTQVKNLNCNHEYQATLNNILQGSGCPVCHGMKDTETFTKQVKAKHQNQYTVLGEYVNNRTKIEVIHNECGHQWHVIPKDLLNEERCPNCISSKGERYIKSLLEQIGIEFETQYRFDDCRNVYPLPFDFAIFINGRMGLIEFDGSQHFKDSSGHWGGRESYEAVHARDEIKNKYCSDKNIPLLRIPYWWIRSRKAEITLKEFISGLESAVVLNA